MRKIETSKAPTAANSKAANSKTAKAKAPTAAKAKAKAKAKPATAAAAKPDSGEKQARRVADRQTVNGLYAAFESQRLSIPVKPVSSYRAKPAVPHPMPRNFSKRQFAALAVAASASGTKLATGAAIPRYFTARGIASVIENGCTSDIIASGLAKASGSGTAEKLTVSAAGYAAIVSTLGEKFLRTHKAL